MTDNKSLVRKLVEVMGAVSYLQKRGVNDFHKYHYATEADVSEAVRKEMVARNIFLLPSLEETFQREVTTRKGGVETVSRARMHYTFFDADSGETLDFVMEGEGQDPGDKGIYKAITGATKYALMKTFLIPTGDDPEGDTTVDERNAALNKKPKTTPKPKAAPRPKVAPKPSGDITAAVADLKKLATVLGWDNKTLESWVKQRTGGAISDMTLAQAQALVKALSKEVSSKMRTSAQKN